MRILLIGDRPSKNNIDPNIPFVGTPSHKILLSWLERLKIVEYELINSYNIDGDLIAYWAVPFDKVVVLGNNAEKATKGLIPDYFKLPHPSPKNRANNDKAKLEQKLKECYNWLYSCPSCAKPCGNEWCSFSNGSV